MPERPKKSANRTMQATQVVNPSGSHGPRRQMECLPSAPKAVISTRSWVFTPARYFRASPPSVVITTVAPTSPVALASPWQEETLAKSPLMEQEELLVGYRSNWRPRHDDETTFVGFMFCSVPKTGTVLR